MAAIGGSIESFTLDGRYFSVAADADVTRKIGGFENEIQMNGDGTGRIVQSRAAWTVSGAQIAVDDANGDLEFLQGLANRKTAWPFTMTLVSGSVYQGTGTITGEIQASSQNATAEISVSGPGELTPQ